MEYNDDHANYVSSFGYILFFAVFHFKTSLHLLKDIELVLFVYKEPEIDYKGQDTTATSHPKPSLAR